MVMTAPPTLPTPVIASTPWRCPMDVSGVPLFSRKVSEVGSFHDMPGAFFAGLTLDHEFAVITDATPDDDRHLFGNSPSVVASSPQQVTKKIDASLEHRNIDGSQLSTVLPRVFKDNPGAKKT